MERVSPPESRHALNLDGLRKPKIAFLDPGTALTSPVAAH